MENRALIDEVELYAATKGIRLYYQFNISTCKHEFVFEKNHCPKYIRSEIQDILNNDEFKHTLRRLIDEADLALNACDQGGN